MSSETGKRNADRLNMIGVVVVGICGAVLTYVSIALLQAFYVNDTAQVETMADYGGQDTTARDLKARQLGNIRPGQGVRNASGTFVIPIERAMELVVADYAKDPARLVPTQGASDRATVKPIYGRPQLLGQQPGAAPAPAPAPAGDTAPPAGGTGTGTGSTGAGAPGQPAPGGDVP